MVSNNGYDFLNFGNDLNYIKDYGGRALSEVFKTLDRPRGAVNALLSGEDITKGWETPSNYQGRNLPFVRNIQNPSLRTAVGGLADVVTDPLNLAVAFSGAPLVGGAARLLGGSRSLSAGRNLAAQYVAGGAARLGSQVVSESSLPEGIKGPLALGAGLAGGALGYRSIAGGIKSVKPNVARMTEEQLNQGPTIFDYLDTLSQDKKVVDYTGKDITNTQVGQAILKGEFSHPGYKITDALSEHIKANTLPEFDVPIGLDATKPDLIARKVNVIPADRAPLDPVLDNSHEAYSNTFDTFQQTNPSLHTMLTNWISSSLGEMGSAIRNAFTEGKPEAQTLYGAGEKWRQFAHQQSELDTNPLIQNGKVYLYRGEHASVTSGVKDKYGEIAHNIPVAPTDFPVASYTSNPSVATGFTRNFQFDPTLVGVEGAVQKEGTFILGRWVPIDDVIGPVGHASAEHEFLVMDRSQIADNIYKDITGTPKDIPLGSKVYAVFNPETGDTVKYVGTEAEAKAASQGSYTIEPQPVAYLVNDSEGYVKNFIVSKAELSDYSSRPGIDIKPLYNQKLDNGMSIWDAEHYSHIGETVDWSSVTTPPPPKQGFLDYEAVTRGHSPDVVAKDLGKLPFNVVNPHGYVVDSFATEAEAKDAITNYYNETYSVEPATPAYTGMFDNPQVMGITGNQGPIINRGFGMQNEKGKFVKDLPLGGGSLVPVNKQQAFNSVGQLSPDQIEAAKARIDPQAEQNFAAILNAGLPSGDVGGIIHGPSSTDVAQAKWGGLPGGPEIVGENTPRPPTRHVITGPLEPTSPSAGMSPEPKYSMIQTTEDMGHNPTIASEVDSLDPTARANALNLVGRKLGLLENQAPQQLIDAAVFAQEKAGHTDPSMIGKVNGILRGMWALGDGSWWGIQGLLTMPRMIATGNVKDAWDLATIPLLTLAGSKHAMGNYMLQAIKNAPEGAPTLLDAVKKYGLHQSWLSRNEDLDFTLLGNLPGFKQSEAAFEAAGDIARISQFYNEWARYGGTSMTEENIKHLVSAINRSTGIAEKPFGGMVGTYALFAPRFLNSQIETIGKALADGTIEGDLARRQLLTLIGTGVTMTAMANLTRGYTSEDDIKSMFNPTDPNFMRIRNVGGQDISVFGPWDSLVKTVVHVASGDTNYLRYKFSPVLTLLTNSITGKTAIGEPFPGNPGDFARNLFLPFAWQNIGKESPLGSAINFFGVKSSPLTGGEIIEQNMKNLGLDPNDPLQRREYLADHPEDLPKAGNAASTFKQANEIQAATKSKAQLNDALTAANQQTLAQFRDNRTVINRTQRDMLSVLLKNQDFKADTPQRQWIQSYMALFDQARNPVTGDVVGPQLDQLQAGWLANNGQQAFDYVTKYLQVGKNPIELNYLQDMNKLRDIGYFDTPKYKNIIYTSSGLTDDQIDQYRTRVSAARSANKQLANMDFRTAAFKVLNGELTARQINAIELAGSQDFTNPAVTAIKQANPELFIWFNPNATYSTYQAAKANKLPIPTLASVRGG